MATTWGSLSLNIYEETYRMASASATYVEIPLIPSAADPTAVGTIVQQGGRSRKQMSFRGAVTSISDYTALLTDHLAGTAKTVTGLDNVGMNAFIYYLGPAIWKETFWEYDVIFLEV